MSMKIGYALHFSNNNATSHEFPTLRLAAKATTQHSDTTTSAQQCIVANIFPN